MPGVPPDAIAQVKRGLKGLFSRKKRDKYQQAGESSSGAQTTSAYTGGSGTNGGQQFPPPPSSKPPQLTEPPAGKPIDLDPSSPSNNLPSAQEVGPPVPSKASAEGMSATSGPLTDELGEFAGVGSPLGSPTIDKGQEFAESKVEAPAAEAEGTEAAETGKSGDAAGDDLASEPPAA